MDAVHSVGFFRRVYGPPKVIESSTDALVGPVSCVTLVDCVGIVELESSEVCGKAKAPATNVAM